MPAVSTARRPIVDLSDRTRIGRAVRFPVHRLLKTTFNGRPRDECLNVHQFASLAEAQAILDAWRVDYNHHRPHTSLGRLTPSEFVIQRQAEQTVEQALCSG